MLFNVYLSNNPQQFVLFISQPLQFSIHSTNISCVKCKIPFTELLSNQSQHHIIKQPYIPLQFHLLKILHCSKSMMSLHHNIMLADLQPYDTKQNQTTHTRAQRAIYSTL